MLKKQACMPVVMTIAGSDSGGGAGIQADLKTFAALNVFGTSAITCVTAQNPDGLAGITELDPKMVALQIRAVCKGFPVVAAKIGMLYSSPLILAVAQESCLRKIPNLVIDPVMVSTSGEQLLRPDAILSLCNLILPRATVITPNLDEAAILYGKPIKNLLAQEAAARELNKRFGCAVVVKGGHLIGRQVTDVLFMDGKLFRFTMPRLIVHETHGTGCTFSAALAATLAHGASLAQAVERAQLFVHTALQQAVRIGRHYPLSFNAAGSKLSLRIKRRAGR